MYENILSGKVAVAGAGVVATHLAHDASVTSEVRVAAASQPPQAKPTGKNKVAQDDGNSKAASASVESFVKATGLDAGFFASKPPAFNP